MISLCVNTLNFCLALQFAVFLFDFWRNFLFQAYFYSYLAKYIEMRFHHSNHCISEYHLMMIWLTANSSLQCWSIAIHEPYGTIIKWHSLIFSFVRKIIFVSILCCINNVNDIYSIESVLSTNLLFTRLI